MTRATNGGAASNPSYVYAIGRIEPRFPRPSVEKEFAQATGRAETAGLTDRQAVEKVLSQRQNRYLGRQLCWVMTIEGLETYILVPRDPADLDLLVEALQRDAGRQLAEASLSQKLLEICDSDLSIWNFGPAADKYPRLHAWLDQTDADLRLHRLGFLNTQAKALAKASE